jgi:hypothetical protein
MLARIRRPIALVLALTLSVGLATHSVPAGNLDTTATGMTAGMSMDVAMDMPMEMDMPAPGKCSGCAGDEKGMMPSACAAFCGSVAALPSMPAAFDTVPAATMWPAAGTLWASHTGPPDPYPPKPVVLS